MSLAVAQPRVHVTQSHTDAILSVTCLLPTPTHPRGLLASASADHNIQLWSFSSHSSNTCAPRACLSNGHKRAVTQIAAYDELHIASASADRTAALWDVSSQSIVRRFRGHSAIVNAIDVDHRTHRAVSGADDGFACVWDTRSKAAQVCDLFHSSDENALIPVIAVCLHSDRVYSGGVDGRICEWDMRMVDRPLRVLVGHSAAVTGLSVCPTNARFLGSRSLDASVRIWDLEAAGEPLDSSLWFQPLDVGLDMLPMRGQWSHDGSFYATGSGCNVVVLAPFAEDPVSSARQLEGHLGLVTDCTFLYSMGGTSHVVVSASVDKSLYITPLS